MKKLLIISAVLVVLVFLLPFVALPEQPLIVPGQAVPADDPETSQPEAAPEPVPEDIRNDVHGGQEKVVDSGTPDKAIELTVWRNDLGQTVEMTLSEYLWGVTAGEMPLSFPMEALRAQAVAARTFTLYKIDHRAGDDVHPDAHLCTDPAHCQAFIMRDEAMMSWGEMAEAYAAALDGALADTDGMVMTYDGQPIMAAYYSTSSGRTEKAADVWGSDVPYLQSVDSPGEQDAPRFQARFEVTADEFWSGLKTLYPELTPEDAPFGKIERSQAGGVISIEICGIPVSGVELRRLFGLNSTNFTAAKTGEVFLFDTLGYGHGVGLSQYGARAMALDGKGFEDILKWYYRGAQPSWYDWETKQAFAIEQRAQTQAYGGKPSL